MRSRARTFYLASLFFPAGIRRDIQTVYAFYRAADDLVDEPPPGLSQDDILATLARWEEMIEGTRQPVDPLLAKLLRVARVHNIPADHLTMIVNGARFDLTMRAIATVDDLRRYAELVAGSVGMVVGAILGARGDAALQAASDLGVAMQLTNILRDVGEDLSRSRVYLPRAELDRAGYSPDDLDARRRTDAFRTVLARLSDEARALYRSGLGGILYLEPSGRFAVYLAARLYERILDEIEASDFDVFTRRAHLTNWERCTAILPCYLGYRRWLTREQMIEGAVAVKATSSTEHSSQLNLE